MRTYLRDSKHTPFTAFCNMSIQRVSTNELVTAMSKDGLQYCKCFGLADNAAQSIRSINGGPIRH